MKPFVLAPGMTTAAGTFYPTGMYSRCFQTRRAHGPRARRCSPAAGMRWPMPRLP